MKEPDTSTKVTYKVLQHQLAYWTIATRVQVWNNEEVTDEEWCVSSKITLQKPGCGESFHLIYDRMIMVLLPFPHKDLEKTVCKLKSNSSWLYIAPTKTEQNKANLIIPRQDYIHHKKVMKLQYV